MDLAFWENGYTTPHFLKVAPALGSVKSTISHELGDYIFF
jgi:hypothetical protein